MPGAQDWRKIKALGVTVCRVIRMPLQSIHTPNPEHTFGAGGGEELTIWRKIDGSNDVVVSHQWSAQHAKVTSFEHGIVDDAAVEGCVDQGASPESCTVAISSIKRDPIKATIFEDMTSQVKIAE